MSALWEQEETIILCISYSPSLCLSVPKVQTVVYCTRSVYPEENEQLVKRVLDKIHTHPKLLPFRWTLTYTCSPFVHASIKVFNHAIILFIAPQAQTTNVMIKLKVLLLPRAIRAFKENGKLKAFKPCFPSPTRPAGAHLFAPIGSFWAGHECQSVPLLLRYFT